MSPHEIGDRLGDMFRLLVGGRRRAQRQQTLQAALDWSYELLSETERVLLRRLATFSGSFMLKAAEGTCSDDLVPAHGVLDLLGSLVTKSLVVTEEREEDTRYRLLETVRLYAAEKLREAGESDDFRSRHRDWYLGWLRSFSWEDLYLSASTGYLLEADLPNLRAALEWSIAEERPDLVASMAGRLYAVWCWLGHYEEGFRLLMASRPEDLDIEPEEQVACLGASAMCSGFLLRAEGQELRRRAIEAAGGRPSGPYVDSLCGLALNRSVVAETRQDAEEAEALREHFEQARQIAQSLPRVWMGHVSVVAGAAEVTMRNLDRGRELLAQAPDYFD
ncbi:MAG: ATP-binding protein, partial [Candidatus Binatia bacterium]